MNKNMFLAIEQLHQDKLCDTFCGMAQTMLKRLFKPPYSISRQQPRWTWDGYYRPHTASALSIKAHKSLSIQFRSRSPSSQGPTSCRNKECLSTEVHGRGGLEPLKLAREPASNSVQCHVHSRILTIRRSLLALVGRNKPLSEVSFPLRSCLFATADAQKVWMR